MDNNNEASSKSDAEGSDKIKRLKDDEKYIPYRLMEENIAETDIKKETVEESCTNLFYETLSGKGKLFLKSGLLYYGNVKYGILTSENDPEGSEIKFPDGTIYIGQIKNNEITGQGKYFFPSGTIYEGELLNGLRNGYGIFESKNEDLRYEGNWKNGLKNGQGEQKKNGNIYVGNWKNGFIDGYGKLKWKSGNIYKGEFLQGKINGNGYMIWFNENKKYSGQWKNNTQNGFGAQIWFEPKGEHKFLFNKYIGEWKNGKRNGYGIFNYSNGAKYEGTWKDDSKEGFGIFTFNDGKKFIGLFKEDHFCGNEQNQISESVVIKYLNESKEKFNKSISNTKSNEKKVGKKRVSIDKGNSNKNASKNKVTFKKSDNVVTGRKSISGAPNVNNNTNVPNNTNNQNNNVENSNLAQINNVNNQNINNNAINNISQITKNNTNKIFSNVSYDKFHFNYQVIEEKIEKSAPKTKYNKTLNKFIPYLQLKKISLIQTDILSYRKEIENTILQNLTEIRRWYQYSNRLILESEEARTKREQEIYAPKECVYTNKVYLCMELKDLWRIFRDSGIMTAPFSLSCFDRLFYSDNYNKTETIFIDKYLREDENIFKEFFEKIKNYKNNFTFENQQYVLYYYLAENSEMTKYLYDIIDNYKVETSNIEKNKKEKNLNSDFGGNFMEDKPLISDNEIKYAGLNKINFDINNSENPLLLYQFYNSLFYVSILYFYFNGTNATGIEKFKKIIDLINNSKPNFKRGGSKNKTGMSKLESSFMVKANEALNEAQRIRNSEYLLIDEFYREYMEKLTPMFQKIYHISRHGTFYNKNDKTIQYRYFYYNIIRKIKILSDIFGNKLNFAEIVSHFHSGISDNCNNNQSSGKNLPNNVANNKNEENNNSDLNSDTNSNINGLPTLMESYYNEDNVKKYKHIEELLYNEMNFYEFVELIFFICRKYYLKKYPSEVYNELQVPRKEKTKEKQREKQNLKRRERECFMEVINAIWQEVSEFDKKIKDNIGNGRFAYKYPVLKTHLLLKQQIKDAERLKELEKQKAKEIERYNLERKNMKEEDNNEYKEEKPEEDEDSSDEEFD